MFDATDHKQILLLEPSYIAHFKATLVYFSAEQFIWVSECQKHYQKRKNSKKFVILMLLANLKSFSGAYIAAIIEQYISL